MNPDKSRKTSGRGKLYDSEGGEFPLEGYLSGLGGKAP